MQDNLKLDFYKRYLSAIAFIVGGYFFLFAFDQNNILGHQTVCLFKRITGYPCAGCGMTRATVALAQGNIPASLHFNMLCIPFTTAIIIVLCWMIIDLIRQRETIYPYLNKPASIPFLIAITLLTAVNWMLNIIHHI